MDSKRSIIYQTILDFTAANSVLSFSLPDNADGFTLQTRSTSGILRVLISGRPRGDITDDVDNSENDRDAATELAATKGTYFTVAAPSGQRARFDLQDVRFTENKTVYVRSTAVTVVEVMIRL